VIRMAVLRMMRRLVWADIGLPPFWWLSKTISKHWGQSAAALLD